MILPMPSKPRHGKARKIDKQPEPLAAVAVPDRLPGHIGETTMTAMRTRTPLAFAGVMLVLAGCSSDPYGGRRMIPPPLAETAIAPVGSYLSGDIVGGRRSRDAKLLATKIRRLSRAEVPAYVTRLEADLRRQAVGTGVEVIRNGEDVIVRMPAAITFAVGSFAIEPRFQSTLREIAQTLRGANQTTVDVLGHTDASGGDAANQALSLARAQAVATSLKARGVVTARIAVKGYGESAPIASNDDEDGRAQNRRIELRIVPIAR
jgi:outer membrane protein OmpA-like peptidoglycan-associated protein